MYVSRKKMYLLIKLNNSTADYDIIVVLCGIQQHAMWFFARFEHYFVAISL